MVIPYLDLHVTDAGAGHLVKFIGLDNRVVGVEHHYPWFAAYVRGVLRALPKVYTRIAPLHGKALIYRRRAFVYAADPSLRVLKIEVAHKQSVPDAASAIKHQGAFCGLYNVRYEVRAAYDYSWKYKLLGFDAPLIFKSNKEMVDDLEKAMDVVSKLRIMAVDIEVLSRSGGFPRKGDPLLSISYATFTLDEDIFSRDWPERSVRVIMAESVDESESRRLVEEFISRVLAERPNIIVTYNGIAFDIPYMKPFASQDHVIEPTVIGARSGDELLVPHIDLAEVRENLGSAMGLRSHVAYALDDVALEVVEQVSKVYDASWIIGSEYVEAERLLNHANLREYWERRDPLLLRYIAADVYLAAIIARVWMYPLITLSLVTGIPPSVLQFLSTGQLAEYVITEYLRRLGFYSELRQREFIYAKSSEPVDVEGGELFTRGKVYVRGYGVFGGNGWRIVELDFNQLYPTDMVVNSVDPTSIFVAGGTSDGAAADATLEGLPLSRVHVVVMGVREKKSMTTISPTHVLRIVHGYGPVSFLMYKLYTARTLTKTLKKKAQEQGRPELAAPDQAIKILNNSTYGCFSKARGNLVSELVSASVFWRTLRVLYDVIDFIDNRLPEVLGADVKVVYGDTDSTYILAPESVDPERIAEEVNRFVSERYGKLYTMSLEGVYDEMVIPKQKDTDAPSGKSYICVSGGKPVKIKGEFFKLNAPIAVKERLNEIYAEIIRRRPTTVEELEEIVKQVLVNEPLHRLFMKKSMSTFVNEDDPSRLKRLNKTFHYAALYTLYLYSSPGVEVVEDRSIKRLATGMKTVKLLVDPREVERTQRAVIALYLPDPSRDPKKFIVYVSDDGNEVVYDKVIFESVSIVKEDAEEKYYEAVVMHKRAKMPRELFLSYVIDALRRDVVDPLARKLLPALTKRWP